MKELSLSKLRAMDPFWGDVWKSVYGRGKEQFRLGSIPTSPGKYQGPREPSLGLRPEGPCPGRSIELPEQTSPAEKMWRERGRGLSAEVQKLSHLRAGRERGISKTLIGEQEKSKRRSS